MKRILHIAAASLLALAALPSLHANAQHRQVLREQPDMAQRHEVKLNLLTSIFMLHPQASYEYLLTHDMTVGGYISFQIPTDEILHELPDFQIAPNYRWYFWSDGANAFNTARGFFVEAYSPFSFYGEGRFVDPSSLLNNSALVSASGMTWGLGVALGWKLLTNHGWSFDIYGGLHRNFVHPDGLPNGGYNSGITIGKRF